MFVTLVAISASFAIAWPEAYVTLAVFVEMLVTLVEILDTFVDMLVVFVAMLALLVIA